MTVTVCGGASPGWRNLFATAVYTRGAMTLQALRNIVGTHDFFTILRTWTRERRDGYGMTRQFRLLAENITGRDLKRLFTVLLYTDQRPAKTAENGWPQ